MISWERFGEWIATVAVASFAWVSGLIAPGVPVGSPAAMIDVSTGNQLSSIMRWAQDEPPVEQVGEGTDVETLDEATPAANVVDTTEDVELLDQGPPPGDQQDIELLDQEPMAATASESPAPPTDSAVPVTSNVAPAVSGSPMLPEGFGTGNVHVSAGSAGFPVGLEDCHVGAVTGRAYVGVDCGEGDGSSFVGHAPSFQEFPFVLDESFPFDQESVFADPGAGQFDDNVQTMVSAARGATLDNNAAAPVIRTSGASSVEFEQRVRDGSLESNRKTVVRSEEVRSAGVEVLTLRHPSRRVRLIGRRPNRPTRKSTKASTELRATQRPMPRRSQRARKIRRNRVLRRVRRVETCSDLNALLKTTRVNYREASRRLTALGSAACRA